MDTGIHKGHFNIQGEFAEMSKIVDLEFCQQECDLLYLH